LQEKAPSFDEVQRGFCGIYSLYESGPRLAARKPSEIWLNRIIVQNGIELIGTWVLVLAVLNSVMAAVHGSDGGESSDDPGGLARRQCIASLVGISWLFLAFLAWYPLEITVYDKFCRYGLVQYPSKYRQPGLLCTPRNFAQSSNFLGKKYFLLLKLPLRNF
jgi:hypothetical protein